MTTTLNNEHKKLNAPNLRFPEYEGEWEKKSLGEIGESFIGLTYKPTDVVSEGGLIVFRSSNIQNGCMDYKDIVRVNKNVKEKLITKKDDLLVCARNGSARLIGKNAILHEIDANQTFGAFMMVFRSDINHFVHQLLNTRRYSSQVSENLGARINQITSSDLSSFEFFFPKGNSEMNKIAALLDLLDERIASQNKIINRLQSLIKGLADNLLDNPLWEKTYLRSFMQFFSTNSLSWEQLSYDEGEIRNLHYGLIHGFQTRGINSASLPMIKNEAVPKQYTLCQIGDVAFADASEDTGEIAKSVEFVDTIEGDTICGLHTIHGRDIKNRTVVGFKGFAFNSRYFHNQIKRLAQGTKVFSITSNNLSSCYVYLPDLETQKAIVKLLKAYEEKLLVSKRLLEQYEKQKQYLLRQMFI